MWLASKFIPSLFKNLASAKAQAWLAGEALTTVTFGRSLENLWFLLIQSRVAVLLHLLLQLCSLGREQSHLLLCEPGLLTWLSGQCRALAFFSTSSRSAVRRAWTPGRWLSSLASLLQGSTHRLLGFVNSRSASLLLHCPLTSQVSKPHPRKMSRNSALALNVVSHRRRLLFLNLHI